MDSKRKYQKKISKIIANIQKNNSSGFFMQQSAFEIYQHCGICQQFVFIAELQLLNSAVIAVKMS